MNEIKVEKVFITTERQSELSSDQNIENTDVIVVLADGHKYTASFFSYAYIEKMRNKNKLTGDFLKGKYFWEKNMVLIEECSPEVIKPVVKDIINEGEFVDIFRRL